jgi:hypothetical protein
MSVVKNHLLTEKYDERQLIQFIDAEYGLTVVAALPETYSISSGSEIGSPFSSLAADGMAASVVSLTAGMSSKIGVTTKRIFMGPDAQDINVDVKFEAYYSAYDEVLVPCVKLLFMATGEESGLTKEVTTAIKAGLSGLQNGNIIKDDNLSEMIGSGNKDVDSFIKVLSTPTPLRIMFGNVFHLHNTYISNANITFSNVLDNDFIPMEATVSLTLTPQDPFTKKSIAHYFGDTIKASRQRRG